MRFFFILLSVRARSELIACALLKLKRIREDYQLLAVAFSSSMVNWVTDITISLMILSLLEMVEVV